MRFFYPFDSEHYVFGVKEYKIGKRSVLNPFSVAMGFISAVKAEIKYGVKSISCLRAGFVGLESKNGLEWRSADEWDSPYYLCVKFKNGRHIPLPIVWNPCGLQGFFIKTICSISRAAMNTLKDAQTAAAGMNE